jgi:hypothetical protein
MEENADDTTRLGRWKESRALGSRAPFGGGRTQVQAGIDDCMRSVVADQLGGRAYDPWRDATSTIRNPAMKLTPVGAAPVHTPGERWVDPLPMKSPEARATDEHIRRIADHFAPHGPASPLRHGALTAEANIASAEKSLRDAGEGDG